jgi:hypothetical protein
MLIKLRKKYTKFNVGAIILSSSCMDDGKDTLLEGIAFYGNNFHSKVINMSAMQRTAEDIEPYIEQLKPSTPPVESNKSLILMFTENQRRVAAIDLEMLERHFPDTPVVGSDARDVLSLSENPEDETQLNSTIKHWVVPYITPVCDKRWGGPSQIILLSWNV